MVVEVVVSEPAVSLDALYRLHRVGLVRLAFLLTGSPEVAEELVQEAFCRMSPRLSAVTDPLAYLRASVTNLARSHHRRQASARAHPPPPPGPSWFPTSMRYGRSFGIFPNGSGRRSSCATTPTSTSQASPPRWGADWARPSRSSRAASPA